ncbi:hypothetical protein OG689_42090 [Kitasatospora sp. NBC_00240]|uniref:hypothetical protein n=1 Tax=Kitasatospora sp. NBC_00240 TaxID=2903567 RepID=UPI0022599507|nr:hypothetical protein [Kitasatospora sp. NBC_00240]MCX5215748.1 hypothetical protein [Kitasatospora sp. NBC_00240]
MTLDPPLIAVIGPVEPELRTAFATRYRALGITRFHLGFHVPDHVAADGREALDTACRDLDLTARIVSTGRRGTSPPTAPCATSSAAARARAGTYSPTPPNCRPTRPASPSPWPTPSRPDAARSAA